MYYIFDLDQTLVDSDSVKAHRDKRNWSKVYSLIDNIRPFKGINELLNTLKSKNHKIGVVTSSPRSYCERIISNLNWSFDSVVCYHDTSRRKPNPDPILLCMQQLGIGSENYNKTYSFGDRDIDVIATKKSGIVSVACTWGAESIPNLISSKPDIILHNVEDFPNKIDF